MSNEPTKIVEYLGETLESKWFINDVTQEEINTVKENYYSFDEEKYWKQLKTVISGGTEKGWMINHINSKHYDKIMSDTKLYHSKWTINELLKSDELLSYFIARTKSNPKVFNKDLVNNVKTAIRLGGKGVVAKPTNFPIKEAVNLLLKYTNHLKQDSILYVDPTAGWGDRLLASIKCGFHYFGIDLNPDVVTASQNILEDIKSIDLLGETQARVLLGDSSSYIPKLKNMADIIMTSPPYFYLEEYQGSKQANRNMEYNDWKENFIRPFMQNNFQYLKNERFLLINITNYKEYDLVGDFKQAGIESGLQFKGYDSLKNIKRTNSKGGFNDNSEDILVFYKE